MKKIILMLVAVFSITFAFAQTQNTTANEKLLEAASNFDWSNIDIAITEGADVKNAKDSFDRNVLMKLLDDSYWKHAGDVTNILKFHEDKVKSGLVQHLIDLGADFNARDRIDDTPLMYAAQFGYYNVVKTLIENGAKVNDIGSAHRTALIKTIDWRREYRVIVYTSHPYNSLIPHSKYINIIKILAKKGKDVLDVQDTNGDTALHIAVSKGEKDVVEILVNAGARKDLINNRNKIPYDYAQELYNELLGKKGRGYGYIGVESELRNIKKIMKMTKVTEKKVEEQKSKMVKMTEADKKNAEQISKKLDKAMKTVNLGK